MKDILKFGPFRVELSKHLVFEGSRPLPLPNKAFDILLALVERRGQLVDKDELLKAVWPDTVVEENNLTVNISALRKALGESPSDRRYIVTVPGRGYRFVAEVTEADGDVVDSPPIPHPIAETPKTTEWRGRARRKAWVAALGVLALSLVAAAVWLKWLSSPTPLRSNGRVKLAVLPFQNLTGDADQDYLSDGLTEEMISQLGLLNPERVAVIARTSVMHYKNTQISLDQIGRELDVQYVLEGSVRRDSNHVRISAQLIQVSDQTHLWSREYDRELKNLLVLQGEIAREIADEIQPALGEGPLRAGSGRKAVAAPTSNEAYDLYLKGRYFWNKRTASGFRQGARYFEQAIASDPSYARAYSGLADTYALMSSWYLVPQDEFIPKARAAAVKALELDPSLAEAHTSLALIAENYDYDWQTAEKEYRRAIALDPGYPTAHQWYAECLSFQGRFGEAFAESERARELDPLSLIIATDHGALLYFSRQYDRAIEQFRAVLDMDPALPRAESFIVYAYVQKGMFEEAEAVLQEHSSRDRSWYWAAQAYVYGRWGLKAQARASLVNFERLIQHPSYDPTQNLILAEVGMDRRNEAIALLQKASVEHSNVVTTLDVEPIYDGLRGDPRFQELLRSVGLVPAGSKLQNR